MEYNYNVYLYVNSVNDLTWVKGIYLSGKWKGSNKMNSGKAKKIAPLILAAVMAAAGCAETEFNWGIDPETSSSVETSSVTDDNSLENSVTDESSSEAESSEDESSEEDSSENESSEDDTSDPNVYPDDSNTKKDETGLYDTTPISDAYLSGDESELDGLQKAILKEARKIIKKVITDGISPIEKELAIHDYICINGKYYNMALDVMHTVQPHSDDPYGMLILGRGICSGYSTTFKMFMDMLGIENMIVHATANRNEEHAWNIVKFEDEWYCVDVTWDDLDLSEPDKQISHTYFNCDEQVLLLHSHQWDLNKIPHANGKKFSFANQFTYEVKNKEELKAAINKAMERCHDSVILMPSGDYDTGSYNGNVKKLETDAREIVEKMNFSGYFEYSNEGVYSFRFFTRDY